MQTAKLKSNVACSSDKIIKHFRENSLFYGNPFLRHFKEGDRIWTVLVMEEYYFRTNSNLSVTVIIDEKPAYTTVEIVSSGGKIGLLLPLSYGAEGSALDKTKLALKELGFVELSQK